MRNKLRRPLAFLLSAVMIVTMSGTPVHAVADRGQPETGLCEHHTAHTDDCGYKEETPGTPCGHEHTEDCYTEVTECVHEHTPECYPEETEDSVSDNEATPANAEEREPENCPHICDGESGCITEKLDCRHEHDSECGYTESTPGTPCTYVCEICNPQDSGEADEEPETGIIKQEQCSCLTLCTEGQINPDCPVCGAEDAGLSDCKGKAEKEDTKQPEDTGICKHHQEHDDACGYQPESEDSEGSPCTYECRICPIEDLIAALPGEVTADNADNARAQLDEILALYGALSWEEQEQIDLSRCYALQAALDGANDPDPVEGVPTPTISQEGGTFVGDTLTLTIGLTNNATSGTYKIGDGTIYTYTSQKEITIGADMSPGDSVTVLLTATDGTETNVVDYTFTKKAAAAKIEKDGTTTYVDESGLDAAFADTNNTGATFTLLDDVTRTTTTPLNIKVNCTLDLGGHTITCTDGTAISTFGQTNVTIQGTGEIVSESGHALVVVGSVTLEGGTFTSNKENCIGVNVNYGTLSVIGENVVIQNTSNGGYGLAVNNAQSVHLSAGTYSGTAGSISIVGGSLTLGGLLGHSGDTRYAYFDENGTTPFTGVLSNKSLTGTVTVKPCDHSTVTAVDNGDGTHSTPRMSGLRAARHWTRGPQLD